MKTIGRRAEERERGRLHHAESGGTIYFLTFRAQSGERFNAAERVIILASCRHGHPEQWFLHGAIVMPDHVHLLLTPQIIHDFRGAGAPTRVPQWISLAEIVKGIKSVTARKINHVRGRRSGPIWQDDYYDRSVRDLADFQVKLRYLMNNPLKQGLAKQPLDWDALWLAPETPKFS